MQTLNDLKDFLIILYLNKFAKVSHARLYRKHCENLQNAA